ncbi:MAG: hypothetical protein ACTSUT_13015 [Promethearchaeota archaeon]
MLNKKIIFVFLLLVFLFSCTKKEIIEEKKEKEPNRSEKPETGLKPDVPVLLQYSFEKIPDTKVYEYNASIDIDIKIIPDQKENEKYLELKSDIILSGTLIKTGIGENGKALFDFKINKLDINIPGPGVAIDYKSENNEKYLNPQIKQLDDLVAKNIPISITKYGKVNIDTDKFLTSHNNLSSISKESIEKIRVIIGYFFLQLPEKEIKIGSPFKSELPFKGEYKIDSLTKDSDYILIIPEIMKNPNKNLISSFLKGWIFVENTGMLKRNYLQLTEKKYMVYNEIKSLVEKRILIDFEMTKK